MKKEQSSDYDFSGVAAPSNLTVHSDKPKPVLYDMNGKPLARPIGFTVPDKP